MLEKAGVEVGILLSMRVSLSATEPIAAIWLKCLHCGCFSNQYVLSRIELDSNIQ